MITARAILAKRQRAYFSSATHSSRRRVALKLMQMIAFTPTVFSTEFRIDHRCDLEAGNMWQLKVCVGAHCVYRRCAIFQVINQDILLLFESSLVSTDCDGEVEPKIIFVLCEEFFYHSLVLCYRLFNSWKLYRRKFIGSLTSQN